MPDKIKVEISMTNAAFAGGDSGPEVARILRKLAANIEESDLHGGYAELLRDVNGNVVGEAKTR
jgi:hypothetical protein